MWGIKVNEKIDSKDLGNMFLRSHNPVDIKINGGIKW